MTDTLKKHNGLLVTESPHINAAQDTRKIMMSVLIALVPAFAMGTFVFGYRVPVLTAVCVGSAVLFEWGYEKLLKKESTIGDLSACVTGAILAFNLPATFPLWMAVIGTFVAIVMVKQLYGGIGKNIANPAIVARVFLLLSFTDQMTTWPLTNLVEQSPDTGANAVDAATGATPLLILDEGGELPELSRLFLGFIEGSCGEVSALAILIGAAFLIWRKIISPVIPLFFTGTVFTFAFIFYSVTGSGDALQMAAFHLLSGGVIFGAVFCATDYVTSPIMTPGRIVYAVGLGVITMVIRLFGSYPEGVSFAILFMNILTPLIDRATIKLVYGKKKGEKEKA